MRVVLAAPLLLGALIAGDASAQSPARWRLRSSAAIAYDSFGQTYTIADKDTLDLIDELSGRVILGVERQGRTWFDLANSLSVGQEATRDDVHLGLRRRSNNLDFLLIDDLHLKAWRDLSQYSLSSDYLSNSARVSVVIWPQRPWRLRLTERLDSAHFEQRTRYNYDYVRNDVGGELERRWGVFSSLRAGYSWGATQVPDSSAIDARTHRVSTGWIQEVGVHTLTWEQTLERRRYRDPETRSPYFDYQGTLTASAALGSVVRLRPAYRALLIDYDQPDSVYANASEQSIELILEGELNERATLGAGPRGEFRRTENIFDRPYDQWGVKGTLSYLAGSALWVQFSNEVGVRRYRDATAFLTDYLYNWTTLILSARLPPRLTFDLFFSLEPEDHDDDRNDTTTILVSTALTLALH